MAENKRFWAAKAKRVRQKLNVSKQTFALSVLGLRPERVGTYKKMEAGRAAIPGKLKRVILSLEHYG